MASLLELARKLHQERLFVRSEQESIYQLNNQIRERSEQLFHMFWTTRQHHLNLNHFIMNSSQGTPVQCSQRATQLDNVRFVDAYKELGYQESMYGDFLQAFRSNPTLAAACLAYGEKLSIDTTPQVVQSVVLGVYGNSIISGDHRHLLELMETLLLLQLANVEQPRRILHKGNAAFCIVYRLFTESLLLGKIFLTSALHMPILQVLMDDELYLERDSNKILDCFSQVEIEKRFGKREEPEFENRIKEHLERTEQRLYHICQSFIDSLRSAMFCFPQSMGWVISRAYHIVKEAGLVTPSEARAMCADLMLQMFICPAIVNPELFGVTGDAPISEFTRFNLMQIAQVLQVLALWDENSHHESSLYGRFDKSCMSSILDSVIDTWHTESAPMSLAPEHGFVDCAVFLTCTQLAQLIQLLKDIQHANVRGVDQASLNEVLSHLPETPPPALAHVMTQRELPASLFATLNGGLAADGDSVGSLGDHARTGSGGSGRGSDQASPSTSRSISFPDEAGQQPTATTPQSMKKKFSKSIKTSRGKSMKYVDITLTRSGSADVTLDPGRSNTSKSGSGSGDSLEDSKNSLQNDGPEIVLVISLHGTHSSNLDPPGMLSENEVLELHAINDIGNTEMNSESDLAPPDSGTLNDGDSERMDKRLRFSLYSTDLSELGEGALEATSSTSGSSIEDMDQVDSVQADDTSSFRGTSSRGNQDEEDEMEEGDLESIPHTNNDEALKALERKLPTSRESIEDKMRKFEIRPQLGVRFGGAVVAGLEEDGVDRMGDAGQVSGNSNYLDTRSDTWSTDAYASDSEAPTEHEEQGPQQDQRLQEIAENPNQVQQMRSGNAGPYLALIPRDEDSRSDVWSVEVLPSDSEPPDVKPEDRLQELESESTAGAEDAIDQLEDNRSRASTPGLSAASGVSGASGLSLVSDNIQAKGGEEHGSSSERSFGKTPSSISPDADDMMGIHRGPSSGQTSSRFSAASSSHSAAGSSHSDGSGEGPSGPTNIRPQTAPTSSSGFLVENQIQSVNYGGQDGLLSTSFQKNTGLNGEARRSKSASPAYLGRVGTLDLKKQSTSPVSMPSGANHLNWPEKDQGDKSHGRIKNSNGRNDKLNRQGLNELYNVQGGGGCHGDDYLDSLSTNSPMARTKPEAASTPDDTGPSLGEIMQSSNQTNTIKRSPYKPADSLGWDRLSAFNSVPPSLARDIASEVSQMERTGTSTSVSFNSSQLSYYNISTSDACPPIQNVFAKTGGKTNSLNSTGVESCRSVSTNNYVKTNGILPGTLLDGSSAPPVTMSTFVPITSGVTYSPSPPLPTPDLSSFDTMSAYATLSVNSQPQILQSKPVSSGNSLLNMNSMSAALVDLSMGTNESMNPPHVARGIDQQSQVPSPIPNHGTGARSKGGHGTKHGLSEHGVERKKSWWKSPRMPVLSTKRKTFKAASRSSQDDTRSGTSDTSTSQWAFEKNNPKGNGQDGNLLTPLVPTTSTLPVPSALDTSGDDIMEKYMRKVASNQSSPKPPQRNNESSATGDDSAVYSELGTTLSPGINGSKLDASNVTPSSEKPSDSQNISGSSTADAHSTPSNISSGTSDKTVTTVTQGTSPNQSLSGDGKPSAAVPVNCLGARNGYVPDSAQLLADAQRKLRLMLATTESLPESHRFAGLLAGFDSRTFGDLAGSDDFQSRQAQGASSSQKAREVMQRSRDSNARSEIISFLQLQLAEAVNLQDHSRIAQIHETTRCIHALDAQGCNSLFQNLWRGYKQRSAFVAYLVRTKQALLTTSSYLKHLFYCTERDQETCRRYLTSVCVGLFLKRLDASLRTFRDRFTQATAADEKVTLVRTFLSYLYGLMAQDPMWECSSEDQLLEAERAIERSVFVYIYKQALYPNGDGDVLRDQLYNKHIALLTAVVTPRHSALLIPAKYLNECPWPSAQAEARSVNAYKTPRDKLAAVLRCCNTIMNLLKMADEGTVPGADDFTPVLVYVLIMANPTNLLSTVQYITSFLGDELTGEDSYWWMQFTAATEFIKTIDERK